MVIGADNPKYKTVLVSDLIPYARNSRTHSDVQVNKIASSIKEFGFLNPVLIDKDNGIIAGHGRVMAAPSCVKIASMGDGHLRIHHEVRWKNAVPKIIREC